LLRSPTLVRGIHHHRGEETSERRRKKQAGAARAVAEGGQRGFV
jgi:hypothetical protein